MLSLSKHGVVFFNGLLASRSLLSIGGKIRAKEPHRAIAAAGRAERSGR
jgi:hypothetical protein